LFIFVNTRRVIEEKRLIAMEWRDEVYKNLKNNNQQFTNPFQEIFAACLKDVNEI